MELCLLNWVEAGGRAHNGAPVKMNENKGRRGTACCRERHSPMKSPLNCAILWLWLFTQKQLSYLTPVEAESSGNGVLGLFHLVVLLTTISAMKTAQSLMLPLYNHGCTYTIPCGLCGGSYVHMYLFLVLFLFSNCVV